MIKSDTRIHHIELLLTLDYLLNYTNEEHPATQQDICRHAINYGLKYDSNAKQGNDVRRQRIGECLKFLKEVCDTFPDKVPFILEKTNSGKYYIEQKNNLNKEDIITILSSIKDNKELAEEDSSFYIDSLLSVLSNVHEKNDIKKETFSVNKHAYKNDRESSRKIRLVKKAFNKKKLILVRWEIYPMGSHENPYIEDKWYRVYKVDEYYNELYALLLPVDDSSNVLRYHPMFEKVRLLNIPNKKEREVLVDDFDENRDLEKLLELCSGGNTGICSLRYKIKENLFPLKGPIVYVSFYFRLAFEKFIKPLYKQFFQKDLEYTKCKEFEIKQKYRCGRKTFPDEEMEVFVSPIPLKKGEVPVYGVANLKVNEYGFFGWLNIDPHNKGRNFISEMITIVYPSIYNRDLGRLYLRHFKRYLSYYSKEEIERFTDSLIKQREFIEKNKKT